MPRYRIVIKTTEIGNWTGDVDAVDEDEAIYAAIDSFLDTPNRGLQGMRWDALPTATIQVVDRWAVVAPAAVG